MKKTVTFKVSGMHCASCAMNIDGELEDTGRILSVSTSYPKQETTVTFDSDSMSEEEIVGIIKKVGYEASALS